MPPNLALAVCAAVVLLLLWCDRSRVSLALWIPTLWLIYCVAGPSTKWTHSTSTIDMAQIGQDGSLLDRLLVGALIFLGASILVGRKAGWLKIKRDGKSFALLYGLMLVSIIWSPAPFVSFKRWIKVCGPIVMGLIIATERRPSLAVERVLKRTLYILIPLSVILIKYFPHFGVSYHRYSGVAIWAGAAGGGGKNTLGALCAVGALYLIWTWMVKGQIRGSTFPRSMLLVDASLLLVILWLLRGSGYSFSATAVLLLCLGCALLFIFRRRGSDKQLVIRGTWLFLSGTALTSFLIWMLLDASPLSLAADLVGRDSNLTGRVDQIWDPLIDIALGSPLLGVGYGGFWLEPLVLGPKMEINQAHNGYLDVFLELGIVGLVLLGVVIVAYFRLALAHIDKDQAWATFALAILLVVIVHNLTESSYLKSTMMMWSLFVMVFFSLGSQLGDTEHDTFDLPALAASKR